ncbi:type I polyketide synthase [Streptomyces aidingensis]|uniref:Phthiocerol/phenolphthiocerol synthesis type-I polyketide synthase C n=1 Tax=Streptomyces aidingensis TaxID=910347 RepID=A0A1I1QZK6_9ACTN|nr:type I polyketide synthase [Streptomyces aidingensis]SFD27407.1 phthiocerol/phenolphthiocerol synthesis type-I polyketide synthase C [Streptomyces aidingensis]
MHAETDHHDSARPAAPAAGEPIAIVGMAGRFPGASDTGELWTLLSEGGNAIRPVPADRWDAAAQLDPEKQIQNVGGFIDGVDAFDPAFFGISHREAADVDPQHRLVLETAWRTLEDAGIPATALHDSATGVYVGTVWHDYELLRKNSGAPHTQRSAVGEAIDVIAARVSYFLRLTGPSLTLATGCSSSLVALHLAAQAIRAGEIEGAMVFGINLILTPDVSVGLTHFGGLSPDGRCAAFGAGANGFVRGEGVAGVYLKPLSRALADGDRVHAVIAGTAVNNDGGGDSLVTPHSDAQEELLRRVYEDSGVYPDWLAYVEAHGTGTKRGDPVEAGAIGRALGQRRNTAAPLPVGSVKSNIGHLEGASGLAGLFKIVLASQHRVVPPSLHAEQLNDTIPFDELNLHVVREPLPLPEEGPLYMGVNSFGWGGTNAHVIITTPPERAAAGNGNGAGNGAGAAGGPVLLPVSAHSKDALRSRAAGLRECVAAGGTPLAELAGTLAWRRDSFPLRAAVVAADGGAAADPGPVLAALDRLAAPADAAGAAGAEVPGLVTGTAREHGRTAFVFPGQGSQWAGMGRELYAGNPAFAAVIDECAEALRPHTDWDLREVITGAAGDGWLERNDMIQPTLWAVSAGIAELWRQAGVEPDVVIGHSQGEVTAATVAGILSYQDAALIIARRSAIARRVSGRGRMLAVDLGADAAREALEGFEDLVSLAVSNGPTSSVLSGDTDAVLALKEILEAEDVYCRLVNVDYASHSPQMDELRPALAEALAAVRPRRGRVPLMSTVRVAQLAGEEMDTAYWVDNLRQPVMFADALGALLADGVTHVVEISPHPVLAPAIEQLGAAAGGPAPAVLTSLRRKQGAPADLALSFARGYVSGLEPFGTLPRGASAPVPGYPWQRSRFWLETGRRRAAAGAGAGEQLTLSPSVTEQDVWQGEFETGPDSAPWLSDHRVDDAVVLPGVAMLGHALAAARARYGRLPTALSDVAFTGDLTFGEGDAAVARMGVVWRDDVTEGGGFTLLSLPDGVPAWTEHATARVWQNAAAGDPPAAFPAGLAEGGEAVTAEDFYAACAARGLNYGPAFQGVTGLRRDTAEVLAQVVLPKRCRAGARAHALHPALWDAALQAVLALCAEGVTVVPTAVRRIELHGALTGSAAGPATEPETEPVTEPVTEVWSHAVEIPCEGGEQCFDVRLYTAGREPLLTMTGVRMRPLTAGAADRDDTEREYRLAFVPQPRGTAAASGGGEWLVAGGDARAGELAGELAEALRAAGTTARAAAEISGDTVAGVPGVSGVAVIAPDAGAGLDAQRAALARLPEAVRAVTGRPGGVRLALVTVRAQSAAAAGDGAPDPGGALFWGFGRVLRREHSELSPLLLDIAPDQPGWAAECAAELLADDGEDQVVLRDGHRLAGRLLAGPPAGDETDAAPRAPWRSGPQPFRLAAARPGRWDGLEFRPLARRAPAPGEVEIAVTAAGLNFIDVMKAMGTYPDPTGGAGLLGGECAGRVVAVGEGVTGLAPGDRVAACVMGAMASHVTVRADHVVPVPDGLPDADAAGLPLALGTAWYGLVDLARLEAGETVLVHSAAGGLGLAAVRVAHALGATVIATAGTEAKRRHLREELGIEHVFDSRGLDWAEGVHAATGGRGVDVVLNSLTGAAIPLGLAALAEDGRFVEVGKKDIYSGRTISLGEFRKGISLASVDLAGLLDRRPERFARLLAAAWDEVTAGRITPLPRLEREFAGAAEALREMSHGTHIGKFVLTGPEAVTGIAPEPLNRGAFRSDGSYLISGGLGGLGLSLAGFLAARGAGGLALLGRSAPGPEAEAAIARWRRQGVRVQSYACDVADENAVRTALARVREELPPLRGVVHAAGVLDDATVGNATPEQIARVLAPKVDGARHLDAATADDPLDMFVLFSSVASLIGNAGQAGYAAGNAYLDALAEARRHAGRPALAVQWGPFAEIGLAAKEDVRGARLGDRGMSSFPAEDGWAALERFLGQDRQVVGYMPLNLRQWFDAYPDTAAQRTWEVLHNSLKENGSRADGGGAFLARYLAAGEEERLSLVETRVRENLGRVLRLDPKDIDRETPFKAMGLDSLMSLELRNRLEASFGLTLSPTLLWTYGTSRALSGAIGERLGQQTAARAGDGRGDRNGTAAEPAPEARQQDDRQQTLATVA